MRLRGSVREEFTLARRGAERLWELLHTKDYVHALGAITGNQAVQMVRAGLQAIYLSGWQVAADGNTSGNTYPDQSLYPVNSVPTVVRRINNALLRADEITWSEGTEPGNDWLAPIVADAEAGFGGPLNAFELAKALIAAGAAGVHYEDQLASEKKCGHLGGKVLVPTRQHVRTLNAARLAADVLDVPTIIVARTDSLAANLITSDVDERDRAFTTGERTAGGVLPHHPRPGGRRRPRPGLRPVRGPHLGARPRRRTSAWPARSPRPCTRSSPARCSPTTARRRSTGRSTSRTRTIARFQRELGAMGYKFQFITLAGFHQLNYGMFELAEGYAARGMSAYVELQEKEFAAEPRGYTATKHQREVGTGYFDLVSTALNPESDTLALRGSTEEQQFH